MSTIKRCNVKSVQNDLLPQVGWKNTFNAFMWILGITCVGSATVFCTPTVLRKHTKATHLDARNSILIHKKSRDVKCLVCDYSACTVGEINRHTKKVHLEIKEHKCEKCEFKTSAKSDLDRHKRTNHKEEDHEDFNCMGCHKSFALRKNIVTHVREVHLKCRPFTCNLCQERYFSRRAHLDLHIKAVHNQIKDQECDYSNKLFGVESNLRKHVREVHFKTRQSKCDICESTFANKCSLARHIAGKHTK